ncbi:MAG: hypothetical protein ACOCRX_12545 [Candidatus Woesearchaeota archaeon]
MKEELISESFFNEVLDSDAKNLFEKYIDPEVFIDFLLKYEIWEFKRLEKDLKAKIAENSLSEEEAKILFRSFINLISHPDFFEVLETEVKKIKDKLYIKLSDEVYSFSKKSKGFIENIIDNYPTRKNEILGLLLKEHKDSIENFSKHSLEFRPLKGIEEDLDEVAMRQMLRTYGSIVEIKYISYLNLIANIFQICELTGDLTKKSPGQTAKKLESILENKYPEYKDLVDVWEITIRNANAHNDFEIKDSNKILIYNTLGDGKRHHKKLLSKDELYTRLLYLINKFTLNGGLYVAILDLLIELFFLGEEKYLYNLFKEIRNDPEIQKLR